MKRLHEGGSSPWLGLMLLASLIGCEKQPTGEVLPTVPVSGLLTYQGRPLEYHQLTFSPLDGQRPAVGTSDPEGRFTLGTNRPGDGAVVGTHHVSIVYVGPPNDDPAFGMNEFDAPPPAKVKIPPKYGSPQQSGVSIDVPEDGLDDAVIALD
ncbi:MAG: hypothetical protein ACF788_02510 [Novipirellula sp. JB048]